jgi:hypothetical protein
VPRHVVRLVTRLVAPLVVDYSRLVVDYSCATTSSCGHAGSTSSTPCVVTTCLVATLALLQVFRAPPRRRLPVASRRPFILTSFPN